MADIKVTDEGIMFSAGCFAFSCAALAAAFIFSNISGCEKENLRGRNEYSIRKAELELERAKLGLPLDDD